MQKCIQDLHIKRAVLDLLSLKVNISPSFLYFSIFNIFLQLEAGLRFKTLHNESNIKCCIVKIYP